MAIARRPFTAERQIDRNGGDSGPSNRDVMDAIAALAAELRAQRSAPAADEAEILRNEVTHLAACIERTKGEIASIRRKDPNEDRLGTATGELDAIVESTERATHNILAAAEQINELCESLRLAVSGEPGTSAIESIMGQVIAIFEACNFQDITGQRTTKVIATLKHIDERVAAMMAIWGEQSFNDMPPPSASEAPADAEAALLDGPQRDGVGISQADIDALFK